MQGSHGSTTESTAQWRRPPTMLGAALGTDLHARSPRLAHKLAVGDDGEDEVDPQQCPPSAGATLGRLFGLELTLADTTEAPALRKRPSSLPLGGGAPQVRPSVRSAGWSHSHSSSSSSTAARSRPSLMKSFTAEQQLQAQAQAQEAAPSPRTRANSVGGRPPLRPLTAAQTELQLPFAAVHSTILESPSPSILAAQKASKDPSADYFFDPQSPEQPGPLLPSITLELGQSQARLAPAPAPALFPRTFDRTHTAQPARSSLGKRSNPYNQSRPSLHRQTRQVQTDYPAPAHTLGNRPTAPGPRRCQSAYDHSARFNAAEAFADMSIDSSMEVSPVRKRVMMDPEAGVGGPSVGSPVAPSTRPRPTFSRVPSKDDCTPPPPGQRLRSLRNKHGGSIGADDDAAMALCSPTAEIMPGFGASEREGKILPCFSVNSDQLMRIDAHTLTRVLDGHFDASIADYHIIDCRFDYEYRGGHIRGAININSVEGVRAHFLVPGKGMHAGRPLPARSQSSNPAGPRKSIIIFHCEFSYKRGPSMALALRQADRARGTSDYPNCHFPELYILEGGYCEFFKAEERGLYCEPRAYVPMDDPRFLVNRSRDLHAHRKQFARHASFAYGDTRPAPPGGPLLGLNAAPVGTKRNTTNLVMRGDRNAVDKAAEAHDTSHSSIDDSPSAFVAGAGGVHRAGGHGNLSLANSGLLKPPPALRTLSAAGTSASAAASSNTGAPVTRAFVPTARNGRPVQCLADLSFGSSNGDDESFEGGPADSPCARAGGAAGANKVQGLGQMRPRLPIGRGKVQLLRAGTTGDLWSARQ